MVKNIYSIYDRVGEKYEPLIILDARVAMRAFDNYKTEAKKTELQDREIRWMGTFDDETGELVAMETKIKVYELDGDKG